MARTPGESRIPVFCSNSKPLTSRLSRPLANLSSKVRAHLSSDSNSKHRSASSSMLFGILSGQNSRNKSSKSSSRGSPTPNQSSGQSYNERPLRPSRFFQSLNGSDLASLKDIKEKKLESTVSSAHIGQKVCVAGQKIGILRYYGKIESDCGWWCGVELDGPYGLNDGSVRGVRYFTCPPQHGVLAPDCKVSLVVKDEVKEYISDVSDSGPHSLLGLTLEINTGENKLTDANYVLENGWCSDDVFVPASEQNSSGTTNVQPVSQLSTPTPGSTCSGGIPIWEWTIGSQHSSSAGSLVPSVRGLTLQEPSQASLQLSKHSSFELDESLGILTPDQMADFTMNSGIEGNLHRTPSSEDAPSFLLLDFEDDKMLDVLTNPNSKRSSLEMQYEETPAQVIQQQAQKIQKNNSDRSCDVTTTQSTDFEKETTIICRDNCNDVTMKDSEDTIRDQLMDQETVCKDLSEDTEMSESHASKKTSDIAMSYEISTETPSNSERAELIRINRTPSLEDLPLDKADVEQCYTKMDELCVTSAGPSRSVLPAPTSFVTSVTSITSLDNGYQGDGEWSRPASRGADHSPSAHQAVKVKPMDPMTDSDFFTESDADMHDDMSTQAGSGTCRGDRRAQVIDGTLYGGVSGGNVQNNSSAVYLPHHQSNQRCPSFTPTNTEEMDSSGIYSDLERRNEEPTSDGGKSTIDDKADNEQQNEKDFSPDGSTKTASSKSDNSQTRMTPADFTALIMEQMNTIKNLAVPRPMEDEAVNCNIMTIDENGYHSVVHVNGETMHNEVLTEKSVNEAKDSVNNNSGTKKANSTKDEHVIKKYKMPKRNVVSKIKTMISSSAANNNNNNNNKKGGGEDENQENRRPGEKSGKAAKKGGRWDAVMNKIAQGKAEEKTKPSRLKEVKSKVFAGISLEPAGPPLPRNTNLQAANSRKLASTRNLTATQSVSTRSLRDVTSLKMKSRRSRTRGSECSLQVSGKSAASQASSRNSSLSDVSLNVSPALSKVSPQSVRSNKKREPGRSTSPLSDGSNNSASRHPSAVSTLPHARPLPQKNGNKVVTEKKTSPNRRKQPPRQTPYEPPSERDLNRVAGSGHRVGASKTEIVDSPTCRPHDLPPAVKPSPPQLPDNALPRLQHATAGFQALSVLINHLVFNLDAFSTPSLKKELERMRADWLKTKLDLEEVRISYTRSEEEKKDYEQRLQDAQYELQAHNKHRQELSSILRQQETVVQELQQRINTQAEELTCREQEIANLKVTHSQEIAVLKKTSQEELVAKEAEMQEKLDVVTKKYEHVKEQSQSLLETLHADKDSKLQVTLGRCKMLEDEVKSLNAVLELRIAELQDLRRQYEIAQHDAQQLPSALQKNSVLQLKIEDLEAQLERKATAEQILSQENRLLSESMQQEAKQKKRLSQYNEELQWKLKQNSEVVNALAALSGVSDISTQKRGPVHIHLTQKTPIQCHTDLQVSALRSSQLPSTSNHKETSPPQSPKVYAVVEKNDSVSWVLEMDESPEDVASRLVRRAHSFRAVHSATPSPAHHSRTLPNPHKRQRSRTSSSASIVSSKPPRMRSFSLDSDNSDVPRKTVANWDDSVSPPTRLKPIINSNNRNNHNEDSIVVETVGDDPLHGFLDLDVQIDAEKLEVMGGEDFASPKMSSSSGDSEASVRSRRNETKTLDTEEIMVINSDHGWISLPKESGGEAMISEETTDTDSTSSESDGDHSCSEDESLSGSASELIERRNKIYIERKIKMELKQQGLVDGSSKHNELKPAITTVLLSDSGSVSAATTAMDLSWSEDVELTSSETEV